MFPEDALFEYVRADLAEMLTAHIAPAQSPLSCDRYIARSCLQKACRRGEVEIAWRALANLFVHDPRGMWRALIVIALEDVGVAGMDVIARVVAAASSKAWRTGMGGDWPIATLLVQQMCESAHCQAACDLLLRCLNDPTLDAIRAEMLEAPEPDLTAMIADTVRPIEVRGMAALALGGGLADGQQHHDPYAVFDVMADAGHASHVVATCRAAWRIGRNEMAYLLPLIWREWMIDDTHTVADDPIQPKTMIGEVPDCAIDQFTRVGGDVARALLRTAPALRGMLDSAGIRLGLQPRAIGDLLFLTEGSHLRRRAVWQLGDRLRSPHRMLATVPQLGGSLGAALQAIAANGPAIDSLRRKYLHRQHMHQRT